MKRTTSFEIAGKEYILCYSTRAVRAVTEKYGSPGKMEHALSESESAIERTETMLFVLHELLCAGARFSKLEGIENPTTPTLDELHRVYPLLFPQRVTAEIKKAITVGSAVSTEIKPIEPKEKSKSKKPKNLKPTIERMIWYGLHLGLDYNTLLDIPHGELLTLINEEQIQTGTAEEKLMNSDEDPFPDWE